MKYFILAILAALFCVVSTGCDEPAKAGDWRAAAAIDSALVTIDREPMAEPELMPVVPDRPTLPQSADVVISPDITVMSAPMCADGSCAVQQSTVTAWAPIPARTLVRRTVTVQRASVRSYGGRGVFRGRFRLFRCR